MPEIDKSGASHIFRGEARLHALDFWIRYPDYLAEELLDLYERNHDPELIHKVRSILADEEPDLRRLPMLRYRFGAYDPVDTAISFLSSRKLIKPRKWQSGARVKEYDFLLFPDAMTFPDSITKDFPVLSWYEQRTRLVVWLADSRGGNALKQQQHKRVEYHATPMGQTIPSIKDKVRARVHELMEVAA
ncbi:MAG: hypothetical protein HQL90_05895 [Magnetococcales bacterium]|nr:hypothetical protein [Magnetococcales bacterium]